MALKVTLSNPSRSTKKEIVVGANALKFPRDIYQKLGSLALNKTLLDDYTNGRLSPEYVKFLDEMNELLTTGIASEEIVALDKYLGDLGSLEEYPYQKDAVNIRVWFTSEGSSAVRSVVSGADNVVSGTDNVVRINNG